MSILDNDERIAKQIDMDGVNDGRVELKSWVPMKILLTTVTFIAGVLIVILMWQLMAWYVNDYMKITLKFPYPAESIQWAIDCLIDGEKIYGSTLLQHIEASLRRVLIAFSLSAVTGIVLGTFLGYFSKIYSIGIVPVTVFQTIPGLAWIPIALLLFGRGDDASIFIIYAVSTMVITINVSGGIRTVPEVVTRASKMMGAGGAVMFIKILLPYSAVSIINGLRLGLGSAWRVLIAAEMLIGTGIGLGSSMETLRDDLNFVGAFGCIVVIVIIGLLIDKVLFSAIEKTVRHKLGLEEGY